MAPAPVPYLPRPSTRQVQLDRLGWTVGQRYIAYGLRIGLRANDAAVLAAAGHYLPLGWQPAPGGPVDVVYSLRLAAPDAAADHLLFAGAVQLAATPEVAALYPIFADHAQLLTAFRARDRLFVHAGVVGWQDQAIVLPGRSLAGKTTLVKALVEAGATYYSDEYAVLDQEGRVHPYPRPLAIRGAAGQPGQQTPVAALGGQAGTTPLPIGLIVVTHYASGARWRPRALSPAQALLALMDNTVAARRAPHTSMPILRQAALGASAIQSARGEAVGVAAALLGYRAGRR